MENRTSRCSNERDRLPGSWRQQSGSPSGGPWRQGVFIAALSADGESQRISSRHLVRKKSPGGFEAREGAIPEFGRKKVFQPTATKNRVASTSHR